MIANPPHPLAAAVLAGFFLAGSAVPCLAVPGASGQPDTDGDGLPDAWERTFFGGLQEPGNGDYDGDGVINCDEFAAGSNPTQVDSDNDGFADSAELALGTDPADRNSYAPIGVQSSIDPIYHLDAGVGVVAQDKPFGPIENNDRVVAWRDQAPALGPNDAEQSISLFRHPFYLASIPEIGGRPAIDFRGEHTMIVEDAEFTTNERTWFIVFRAAYDSIDGDGLINFRRDVGTYVDRDNGGRVLSRSRGGPGSSRTTVYNGGLGARANEFFIVSSWNEGNTLRQHLVRSDGTEQSGTSGQGTFGEPLSGILIGGTSEQHGLLDGQIAEIIVYDRRLTAPDRRRVNLYLFHKYFGAEDLDHDNLPDDWERSRLGGTDGGADGDPDRDNRSNRQEFQDGTDPLAADSDGDGLEDGTEIALRTNPLLVDSDRDGWSDALENLAGSDPVAAGSAPSALFRGLLIYSSMDELNVVGDHIVNLAGPGHGVLHRGRPGTGVPGSAVDAIRLGPAAGKGVNYGDRSGSPLTVTLWFKPETLEGTQFLASKGARDFQAPGWSISLEGERLVVRVNSADGASQIRFQCLEPVVAGRWYSVGLTGDPDTGEWKPHLDGQSDDWDPAAVHLGVSREVSSASPLLLGVADNDEKEFTGCLDEFCFWDRALSPDELLLHFSQVGRGTGLNGKSLHPDAPVITTHPQSAIAFPGQSAGFTVQGSGATSFAWHKDGVEIPSASSATLTIPSVTLEDGGRYHVELRNASGVRSSRAAVLAVKPFQIRETQKIKAGDPGENDRFGNSLSIDGDTLVIGAAAKRNPATRAVEGRVYYFERDPNNPDRWIERRRLSPLEDDVERMGRDVLIDGDLILAAAQQEVFPDCFGRILVHERDRGGPERWGWARSIPSATMEDNDSFGFAMAITEETLAASSIGSQHVTVYDRRGNTFAVRKVIPTPGNDRRTSSFGRGLAMRGDTLVIGDPNSGDSRLEDLGVVHIHERNEGGSNQWGRTQQIRSRDASPEDSEFGFDVRLDGDSLAVTAPEHFSGRGAAYLYRRDPGTAGPFQFVQTLRNSDSIANQVRFGWKCALGGGYLVVSEIGNPNNSRYRGAATIYREDPGNPDEWTELARFTGSDTASGSSFGSDMLIQGNELIVGAAEFGDHPTSQGSAYVFRFTPGTQPALATTPKSLAPTRRMYNYQIQAERVGAGDVRIRPASPLPPWLSFVDNGDGTAALTGEPSLDDLGTVPISLVISEPYAGTVEQSFTLHVVDGNRPPIANSDPLYSVVEDGRLVIDRARGVLANDTDADDGDGPDNLTAHPREEPANGTLVLNADGSFVYTPDPDYHGPDSFTYAASDGEKFSNSVRVDLEVTQLVDLNLISTVSHATIGAPRSATHTITIRNQGPSNATNLVVDLTLVVPEDVAANPLVPTTGTFTGTEWMLDLAENQDASLLATYAVSAEARGGIDVLTTTASVGQVDQPLTEEGDDSTSVSSSIISPADIGMQELDLTPGLDFQTGLFTQQVTITNNNPLPLAGFRLMINDLPAGVLVYNAHGTNSPGSFFVESNHNLAAGEPVTFTLEFFQPSLDAGFKPDYLIDAVFAEDPAEPSPATTGAELDRVMTLGNGDFLLEFPSTPGETYAIEYSHDMVSWHRVVPAVSASASRTQWIDSGPPKTSSHPSEVTNRYYRLVHLPNSPD